MEKLRIIVGGYIGSYCTSGVTWDYIQYPLGLHLLGHDVYYLEDTLGYYCHSDPSFAWDDPTPIINYFETTMKHFGLDNRWVYRDAISGKCFGLSQEKLNKICATTDVFINVSNSTFLREEYLKIPNRILIDSDPMFTQIPNNENSGNTLEVIKSTFSKYNYLFSFGENINSADSKVPTYGFKWNTTRQPICLKYWDNLNSRVNNIAFSTIMNLAARKRILYNNEQWGQKDIELEKFLELPRKFRKSEFQIFLTHTEKSQSEIEEKTLEKSGWKVLSAIDNLKDIKTYNKFIKSAYAEFSVAKETYVKANTGWFSCRSACYLASGKPVIVQDTKWSKYIPSGKGLFAFQTNEDALNALEEVVGNYYQHSKASKEIAIEYFDSNRVLTSLLNQL